MLPDLSKLAENMTSLAQSMEKIAGVAGKVDELIEAAGGVEGIKEKLTFLNDLRQFAQAAPPAPDKDA
jgi:hypothetical protein